MELAGKIALVTGSARGIGRAIAVALARNGADVVVNYVRNEEEARKAVEEINILGRRSFAVQADVARSSDVKRLFRETLDRFGTLDILVNNAGQGMAAMVEDISEEEWNYIINLNLNGVFLCCKEAIPIMKAKKSGKIVTVSSVAGIKMAYLSGAHYTAAKFAVNGFTRHLAYELAPYGINVNAVCPGLVLTPLVTDSTPASFLERVRQTIPAGRISTPEDQANAVLFLVSDKSRMIVGETLVVDGGSLLGWQTNEVYERGKKKAFALRSKGAQEK